MFLKKDTSLFVQSALWCRKEEDSLSDYKKKVLADKKISKLSDFIFIENREFINRLKKNLRKT